MSRIASKLEKILRNLDEPLDALMEEFPDQVMDREGLRQALWVWVDNMSVARDQLKELLPKAKEKKL